MGLSIESSSILYSIVTGKIVEPDQIGLQVIDLSSNVATLKQILPTLISGSAYARVGSFTVGNTFIAIVNDAYISLFQRTQLVVSYHTVGILMTSDDS
jgi:hypothetical protein